MRHGRPLILAAVLLALIAASAKAQARQEPPWDLLARQVPFDDDSAPIPTAYAPLTHASQPWRLCVLYPHLNDAYG